MHPHRQIEQLRPGSLVLGRFRIVTRLGGGAFADVYLARTLSSGQLCVVKAARLGAGHGRSSQWVAERFDAEVRAACLAAHPNLVRVLSAGLIDGCVPAIAMEHVDGAPLSAYLAARSPLPAADVQQIFLQLASALAAVHAAGVVHCDVTPNNIIVTEAPSLRVTLLDFGISQIVGEGAVPAGFVGTPRYMPSEQLRGQARFASDMYALGGILWWATTGEEVFDQLATVGELLTHQMSAARPPDPRRLAPAMSEALTVLLQELLHPDPARRPSPAGLIRRLPHALAGRARRRRRPGRRVVHTSAWGGIEARPVTDRLARVASRRVLAVAAEGMDPLRVALAGLAVDAAHDAHAAWSALATRAYDAVILGLSGQASVTFIAAVRDHDTLAELPIIAFGADADLEHDARAAGADAAFAISAHAPKLRPLVEHLLATLSATADEEGDPAPSEGDVSARAQRHADVGGETPVGDDQRETPGVGAWP